MAQVQIAAVGREMPAWASRIAQLGAATLLVRPEAVEGGLNRALSQTTAPFFLVAAADDSLSPSGVAHLAETLRRRPAGAVGAVGAVHRLARDGSRHRVAPVTLNGPADLLRLTRTPTPVLLRTEAVRAVGGWRPGEACWDRRPLRHRALLARILERGSILGVPADLGVIVRPADEACASANLPETLASLLFHRIRVTGRGLEVTGRVAAVCPDLLTLATSREGVALVRVDCIGSVTVLPEPGNRE